MDTNDEQYIADKLVRTRENRLRRAARRQGLRLEKCPRRDPRAIDYGTYRLVHIETRVVVWGSGSSRYGLTLDEVEDCLL